MTWDDVLRRMEAAGMNPVEETYMENYGKILSAQRPEFRDRIFRCTYGVAKVDGIDVEAYVFPDETQCSDFMDVVGHDPWWLARGNVVLHFPECDPVAVTKVMDAIS
jgi:hypothetical protein